MVPEKIIDSELFLQNYYSLIRDYLQVFHSRNFLNARLKNFYSPYSDHVWRSFFVTKFHYAYD